MDLHEIKQRFAIVANDEKIDQAIDTAVQVAPIQLSVLILGESGAGKESFPQIIHAFSSRKHQNYVAVNCGAIPEGTIDSELFGHEKGSFTGAVAERKGYFEEANGGTIFLDEIGELPLATQAKLLRVLEKGEYMRVGSSMVKKTDVRVVAATNVDLEKAIAKGTFRQDLYYRLNGVTIRIPPLRERKGDIPALFHRFTNDFADQNKMPSVHLTPDAVQLLQSFSWPGNVRQLKNVANQVTALSHKREIDAQELARFMPHPMEPVSNLPSVGGSVAQESFSSEREILYKILFDMRKDVSDLKKLVMELISNGTISQENASIVNRLYQSEENLLSAPKYTDIQQVTMPATNLRKSADFTEIQAAEVQEMQETKPLSLDEHEREMIKKTLEKYYGNRRRTAEELGISERTLYRKIHEYKLDL